MSFPAAPAFSPEVQAWRHTLHAYPEVGFEETRTAGFVAAQLRRFGLDEVVEGVGGTGVVGTLRRGHGPRTVALRADMDALRLSEQGPHAYRSQRPGLMHACGHDGHTSMLLGAAQHLAATGGFDGTVRFVFQPAEEWGRGAQAMLADGLLTRFPYDEIYGLHNWPGLPVGQLATRPGPLMAAEDLFDITLRGVGGHASRPQAGREVMVAASALVLSLQTIVARRLDPVDIAVVSVTELLTDGTRNVLPSQAVLRGDARSFRPEVSAAIEAEMRRLAAGTAQAYDCEAEVNYTREFVPVVNAPAPTARALQAAAQVFGPAGTDAECAPVTVAEDFARLLRHTPGNFAFLGNGADSWPLHHPRYDFNDAALPYGVAYWVALVQTVLPIAEPIA